MTGTDPLNEDNEVNNDDSEVMFLGLNDWGGEGLSEWPILTINSLPPPPLRSLG